MEIRPILSALRRSPTGAVLVALQIALALAISVNALYIIVQRVEKIGRDPGIDVPNLFIVGFAPVGREFNGQVAMREDLQVLRSLPGVVSATATNAIPLSGGGSSTMYFTEPGEKGRRTPANYFEVDEHGIDTFGVELVEGRGFGPEVITVRDRNTSAFVPELVLTQAVAEELFPGKSAVGQTVYDGLGQPAKVVGVVRRMHGAWPEWEKLDHVALHPQVPDAQMARYLVRTAPGERDRLMVVAEEKLAASRTDRIITRTRTLEEIAANSYASDRAMAIYLVVVIVLLIGIGALGIFGLAAFNVATRTKQIGTRRAVGARRGDIVRYFLLENWLVTTVGIATGCVLALLLGYWLSTAFELPRLKLYYLLAGVIALWAVGLAAALVPARRASRVSPAVATRTV